MHPAAHSLRCLLIGGACLVGAGAATVARAAEPHATCVTPTPPAAPGPARRSAGALAGTRAQAQANVFFINYDGATLVQGEEDDAATDTTVFAEFAGTYAPYGAGSKRAASLQAVRSQYAAYAVTVVDYRPPDGLYTMCVATPTNPFGEGVLGAAPPDCEDATPSNVVLAFHGVDDEFSAAAQATTISHEIAHAYGLEHVDQPADTMNPSVVSDVQVFLDECLPLIENGSPIRCDTQHRRHCGDDLQGSHPELMWLFGPSTPDTEPPEVVVTQPTNGDVFTADEPVTIVAEAHDDIGVAAVDLYVDDAAQDAPDYGAPLQWLDRTFAQGDHCLRVDVRDHGDNLASSPEVCFTVLPGEDDEGEPTGAGSDPTFPPQTATSSPDDPGDGDAGCGCAAPTGSTATGLLAALLGLLRRRRRSAGHVARTTASRIG